MPSLIFLGRRWRIGSDDFVFPGCFEAIVRAAWLILTVFLFLEHLHDWQNIACTKGQYLIRIYLIGVIIIITLSLIGSMILVFHSARGLIMQTTPRRHVPKILTFRIVLGVVELGWNILGTIWLYSEQVQCKDDSVLWTLLKALVIFTWTALPILVLAAYFLFDPMMRPDIPEDDFHRSSRRNFLERTNSGMGSHYIQLWEKRCRRLCCSFLSKDENSAEAFRNVAEVLASVFEETDLVASDIAAALVLLRLKRKCEEAKEQERQKKRDQHLGPRSMDSECSTPNLETPPPEWMNINNAYHYMKHAMGSYGWPWYCYGRMCYTCCTLHRFIKCCACCRPSLSYSKGDNCCMCNVAALMAGTGLSEEDIIYISFSNQIYECPFFVAIDDETKAVVVSIRGTLSLRDAITDLNAQCTLLEYEGLPSDCKAHKGVVNAALYVQRKLEETDALNEAFKRTPDYDLVITGHSLGGGAAVILAAMLRSQYPNLKCFAFSPPGGLCSMQMSKTTEEYVMSIVIGDDIVPRLSLNAIHDLYKNIISVLNNCRKPKYRVLAKGCWYLLCGISKSSLMASADESNSQDQLIATEAGLNGYVRPSVAEEETVEDIRVMFSEARLRPVPRHTETLLFLPGRVIYVKPKLASFGRNISWGYNWTDTSSFDQILISPNMLRHHLPVSVLAALMDASNSV